MGGLTKQEIADILSLAATAEITDGHYPLNETAIWNLQAAPNPQISHFTIKSSDAICGYAQADLRYHTAQLVVAPTQRRLGLATTLLQEMELTPVWAFGNTAGARQLASKLGYLPIRQLAILENTLDSPNNYPSQTLQIRHYSCGDLDEVVRVNASAFIAHPEQGKLTRADFEQRMCEEWFDPAGLLLGFDSKGLVGFIWTKRHDPQRAEVYVIAVAPDSQGSHYGSELLFAGMAQLAYAGVKSVFLYVDIAETIPLNLYLRSGFAESSRDVLYAPGGSGGF
ncbi:MAG: mycothiol synthase [Propionibacteriaceae bacterium]|nr:mycothiol synthase [Propionibacteriaceae bacterium]